MSVAARRDRGLLQSKDGSTTLFDLVLEPDEKKGYEVPTLEKLVDEAFLFLVAGSDTTAYTMSCATFYLLNDQECLARLRAELQGVPRDTHGRFEWKELANLPYLVSNLHLI